MEYVCQRHGLAVPDAQQVTDPTRRVQFATGADRIGRNTTSDSANLLCSLSQLLSNFHLNIIWK